MDVQDDSSQRVLCVAVVKARRPRDGVIADELVVWIPGRDNKAGVTIQEMVENIIELEQTFDTHRHTHCRELTWFWLPAAGTDRRWPGRLVSCPRLHVGPDAGTALPRAACTPRWGGRPPPSPLYPSSLRGLYMRTSEGADKVTDCYLTPTVNITCLGV